LSQCPCGSTQFRAICRHHPCISQRPHTVACAFLTGLT
jgi:hypothetical protein